MSSGRLCSLIPDSVMITPTSKAAHFLYYTKNWDNVSKFIKFLSVRNYKTLLSVTDIKVDVQLLSTIHEPNTK